MVAEDRLRGSLGRFGSLARVIRGRSLLRISLKGLWRRGMCTSTRILGMLIWTTILASSSSMMINLIS